MVVFLGRGILTLGRTPVVPLSDATGVGAGSWLGGAAGSLLSSPAVAPNFNRGNFGPEELSSGFLLMLTLGAPLFRCSLATSGPLSSSVAAVAWSSTGWGLEPPRTRVGRPRRGAGAGVVVVVVVVLGSSLW